MHKLSSRVLIGLVAVGLAGLTWGCSRPADSTSGSVDTNSGVPRGNSASSISATSPGKTGISLSMPESGRVTLVNSEVLRGQISIDAGRQVTVKAGNSEKSIPFDQLGRVMPDKDAPVYRSSGELVIRGPGSKNTSVTDEVVEIGWGDFLIVDKELRQVQVMLPNQKYEGIISVARDSQYVVEEIVFDPQQQKMTIRVRAE